MAQTDTAPIPLARRSDGIQREVGEPDGQRRLERKRRSIAADPPSGGERASRAGSDPVFTRRRAIEVAITPPEEVEIGCGALAPEGEDVRFASPSGPPGHGATALRIDQRAAVELDVSLERQGQLVGLPPRLDDEAAGGPGPATRDCCSRLQPRKDRRPPARRFSAFAVGIDPIIEDEAMMIPSQGHVKSHL